MTAPQAWEDVASDVSSAIQKALQPLIRRAADDIYERLLDTTQDYLAENVAFNLAERISAAEREAASDRMIAEQLRGSVDTLVDALSFLESEASAEMDPSTSLNRAINGARRLLAKFPEKVS